MKTTGNTIFLAGGTSGLGLGLAQRFLDLGNKVIISGRRKELLDQLAAEHPGLETIALDVADPDSITDTVERVIATHPDVNVVITMAGIMHPENLRDANHLSVSEATITTNLLGTIRVISAFLPHLLNKPDAAVLTVSSGLAFVPLVITPTYNATKAAIHSYTQSLRLQLADTSVQVIELIPPAVQTALMGQENDERALPLDTYLTDTIDILQNQPDVTEVVIDRVKFLRNAEPEGRYAETLAALNSH
ncbi:short-subunit dehydrogenase involved in D-alanine esterification of teichoic acids [Kribbella voronezhensis]|uniref:Short-subunit dehydrogenase involved in D-alanine esterification of teichoic acids n=1 Tax=Kribbella voronezhensis TaxID=2512212 RepID=A0A4R7TFC7_9ACTN|nr:SDR family NAD(P)-dependent oxidoreductase [Kribbella voronezhensis]TDU90519.1 short-subunit dehydrogenase involved in D-alanine esterification of teichoic acids [Kribbella voronezhensis]